MKRFHALKKGVGLSVSATALLGCATLLAPTIAGASSHKVTVPGGPQRALFVQTDNPSGNRVAVYQRAPDGTLTLAGSYATGGLGGVLKGSVADHLSSQGSMAYDQRGSLLYVVNAGSNTLSVFSVRGDELSLRQVVSSGGVFPVSVTVHNGVVYVLNAMDGGSIQGYFSVLGYLIPIAGSNRLLGLTIPNDTTQFTHTPGQIAFTPQGSQLIVTTKLNLSDIDVYSVGPFGNLSPEAVVNSEPGTGPFGVSFDQAGRLVVADVGDGSLASYSVNPNGTLAPIDSVATTQAATCWVAAAGRFFYTSNAGSSSLSGFAESLSGQLSFLGDTSTDPGTVDASSTPSGTYLYVRTGAEGIVDEFRVGENGSLTKIGSVTVATAVGGEGIVVT